MSNQGAEVRPIPVDHNEESTPFIMHTQHTDGGFTPKNPERGLSLDEIFSKIGFGAYQIRLLSCMGLVAFSEGSQIIISSLCMTILQNQWQFSNYTASLIASLFFLGVLIGSAISGFFADKYGRKLPVLWSLGLMTLFNILSGFAWDIPSFIIFRSLLGILMGFFTPMAFTIVAENVPIDYRGRIVMIANGCMFLGVVGACVLSFFLITNLVDGNWRALVFYSSAGFLIPLVWNIATLDESVRYSFVMGKFDQAYETLEKIIKFNKLENEIIITEDDKHAIKKWQEALNLEITDEDVASVRALFKPKYRVITIIVWAGWFCNSFVYYGMILFIPYILARLTDEGDETANAAAHDNDIKNLLISSLIEFLSVIVSYILIDCKTLGRKEGLILFYFLTGALAVGSFFEISRMSFIILATFVKLTINICSFYFYLYTAEIYPTKYRGTGIGMAAAVGKFGAIFMPWFGMFLIEFGLLMPMLGFGATCIIMALVIANLPLDTRGMELK